MKLFRAWESLPEYGVSLFVVKFHGEKKEELLVSHLCLPLFLTIMILLDDDDCDDVVDDISVKFHGGNE